MSQATSAAITYTVGLIKPDAIRRGLVGAIITEIERSGLAIGSMRKAGPLPPKYLAEFYAEHDGRAYFEALIDFMSSGPIIGLLLSSHAPGAQATWRRLMGPSNPTLRPAGTIRGRYALGCPEMENLVHGSDSPAAYLRELELLRQWGCL